MGRAHERKKQPEVVRRSLVESAIQLAAEKGFEAVTVQAVSALAGVTKGGLTHHFACKQELLEAAFQELVCQFDQAVAAALQDQPREYGVFTRAYIHASLNEFPLSPEERRLLAAVPVMIVSEPSLRHCWTSCQSRWLERYRETDDHLPLRLIRAAVDGLWMECLIDPDALPNLPELIQGLLERTLPEG